MFAFYCADCNKYWTRHEDGGCPVCKDPCQIVGMGSIPTQQTPSGRSSMEPDFFPASVATTHESTASTDPNYGLSVSEQNKESDSQEDEQQNNLGLETALSMNVERQHSIEGSSTPNLNSGFNDENQVNWSTVAAKATQAPPKATNNPARKTNDQAKSVKNQVPGFAPLSPPRPKKKKGRPGRKSGKSGDQITRAPAVPNNGKKPQQFKVDLPLPEPILPSGSSFAAVAAATKGNPSKSEASGWTIVGKSGKSHSKYTPNAASHLSTLEGGAFGYRHEDQEQDGSYRVEYGMRNAKHMVKTNVPRT